MQGRASPELGTHTHSGLDILIPCPGTHIQPVLLSLSLSVRFGGSQWYRPPSQSDGASDGANEAPAPSSGADPPAPGSDTDEGEGPKEEEEGPKEGAENVKKETPTEPPQSESHSAGSRSALWLTPSLSW